MAATPTLSVAMIGTSTSGKTSYLHGMYATLSAGFVGGYFLYCHDEALDRQLLADWDKLCVDGRFPEVTRDDTARKYPFVLNQGTASWLHFDLFDCRGGILKEPGETSKVPGESPDDSRRRRSLLNPSGKAAFRPSADRDENLPDVRRQRAQIAAAETLYLVISCEYLAEPVTGRNYERVLREAGLRQITTELQREFDRRTKDGQNWPSLVLLLTKADLLQPRQWGKAEKVEKPEKAVFNELVEDVRKIIPIAFTEGVNTLLCPVRLGFFKSPDAAQVDAPAVDPNNLLQPIAYTLMQKLRYTIAAAKKDLAWAEASLSGAKQTKKKHEDQWFKTQSRARDLAYQVTAAQKRVDELRRRVADDSRRQAELAGQLNHLPIFESGKLLTREPEAVG